jgi:hypothetical protein
MQSQEDETARLEHELEADRDRIEQTLDSIQRKLTPGQLLDEGLGFLKRDTGGIAADVMRTVTANPIPAALIGLGLIWLAIVSVQPGKTTVAAPSASPDARPPAAG